MKKPLKIIVDFVDAYQTADVPELIQPYPYQRVYRSVAAVLLSGRIRPTYSDLPNKTEIERFCKEANFNNFYFFRIGTVLLKSRVLVSTWEQYEPGPCFDDFFSGGIDTLQAISKDLLPSLVDACKGRKPHRPTLSISAGLTELVTLFWTAFHGRGIRSDQFGKAINAFAGLPEKTLQNFAIRQKLSYDPLYSWDLWTDSYGRKAIIEALFTMEWVFYYSEGGVEYVTATPWCLVMLGLEKPPLKPVPIREFKVLSDNTVFAGEDLPIMELALLFKSCTVQKMGEIITFRIEPGALGNMQRDKETIKELKQLIEKSGPLPKVIEYMLTKYDDPPGALKIYPCSGIVKLSKPEQAGRIRAIHKLKGYIGAVLPPGYLIIKNTSSLNTFIKRCADYGFDVQVSAP